MPLGPFNTAKHAKPGRHEILREDSTLREWDSSHAVTKASSPQGDTGGISGDESVEGTSSDKPVEERYTPAINREAKDRRTVEDADYEAVSRYPTEYESVILPRGRKQRPSAVLTDELRYETTEDARTSGRSVKRTENHELTPEKDDDLISRSRYRETFKVHPNEYELNDEEYQKPRPRKRRPPQHYESSEIRAPTYSITWSTEKYVERVASSTRSSTKRPEVSTRRRPDSKNTSIRRDRNKSAATESQRTSENAELKSLLKMQQIEGLSLSEILQRRNLTLNDLLKGKVDVINVLKSTDSNEDSTGFSSIKPKIFESNKVFETTERPRWEPDRPPDLNIFDSKRNEVFPLAMSNDGLSPRNGPSNETDENYQEKLDSAETEDVQRKSNDNEKLSVIVRLTEPIILPRLNSFADSVITVASTTKTLSSIEDDEIMEFSDFTMNKHFPSTTIYPIPSTTKNGLDTTKFNDTYEEDSGSTLSIEHILSATEQTPTFLPGTTEEPHGSDNKFNNVVAASARSNNSYVFESFEYQSDELREVIEEIDPDEEELPLGDQPYETFTKNPDRGDESSDDETLLSNHQIFSTSSKPYEVEISEIEPEARAEIFELFSSGSSAKRLERLLMSRNMSIGELIALRQRGSSRIHLAEVMRLRETLGSRSQKHNADNQAPGKPERGEKAVTTEDIFSTKTPTESSEDLSDIEIDATSAEATERSTTEQKNFTTKKHMEIGDERGESASTTEPSDGKHIRLLDLLTAFDSLPFSVRPEFDSTARPNHIEKITTRDPEARQVLEDQIVKTDSSSEDTTSFVEVGFVEQILSDDSTAAGNLEDTNASTNYSSDTIGEDRKISSKVRPSIIASGAILGVTIVVFLAIFIVCRIRQKQKYTYRNTFSRAVFQGPVMTARKLSNSSSSNTIMGNVVATSTAKRPERRETQEIEDDFEFKSDIENDSLDANDSWETIPDFMK